MLLLSSQFHQDPNSPFLSTHPLRHLQTLPTAAPLYLQTCIVLSSPRKCSLDPGALYSYCCIFFPFCCWTFQISRPCLLPPFPLTYPETRVLFSALCRKEFLPALLMQSLLWPIYVSELSPIMISFPSPSVFHYQSGFFHFLPWIQTPSFLFRFFTDPLCYLCSFH